MYNIERHMDARQARRMAAETRYLTKLDRQTNAADQMIGELSSGKYYVYPVGGKYRESDSHAELVDFLIRNHYV